MKTYTARVFMTGRSQAIRLPKECRVQGADLVKITKESGRLYIEPIYDSWAPLLDAIDDFPDEVKIEKSPTDKSHKDLF